MPCAHALKSRLRAAFLRAQHAQRWHHPPRECTGGGMGCGARPDLPAGDWHDTLL